MQGEMLGGHDAFYASLGNSIKLKCYSYLKNEWRYRTMVNEKTLLLGQQARSDKVPWNPAQPARNTIKGKINAGSG
jgi:hypothetical protein